MVKHYEETIVDLLNAFGDVRIAKSDMRAAAQEAWSCSIADATLFAASLCDAIGECRLKKKSIITGWGLRLLTSTVVRNLLGMYHNPSVPVHHLKS